MRTRTLMAAGGAAAMAMLAGTAAANHVDFIEDGVFDIDGEGSTTVIGSPDNILGGVRSVTVSGEVNGGSELGASYVAGDDCITFTTSEDENSMLTLDYGAFPGGSGPLNSDFGTMWNFLRVEIGSMGADAEATMMVTFESSAGNATMSDIEIDGAGNYDVAFDDTAFTGVDFLDVDRITVKFTTDSEATIEICGITREIPAPGSLAAAGVFALAFGRRRR